MYSFDNKIIGCDEEGYFIGRLTANIIVNRHRISEDEAVELIKRWANR